MPRQPSRRKNVPRKAAAAAGKAKTQSILQIDSLFDSFANSSLGLIDPEGIEALCSQMKVEVTDVRILMLAWKLKAQKQGYFTRTEWRTGMTVLGVDSIDKLVQALPELEKAAWMPENFADFYSYAFQYSLTEEKQKHIDIGGICELLSLVLRSKFHSKVDSLIDYLKIQTDYRVISHDQWMGFLRFCEEINFPDLENYDSNEAWPLILDNFVEWVKGKCSS